MPRRHVSSWHELQRRPHVEQELATRLRVHPLAAAALAAANITEPAEARAYLSGSLDALPDPGRIRGMAEGARMIARAVAEGRQVLVHGDYDADGICSSAILTRALHTLGAHVHYFLPDRFVDDYGVSERAVRAAARAGIDVIMTVDCGITAHDEIATARSLGCHVIVLDHHEPDSELPPADVVIAPRLPEWEYECQEMPASALALRFVQALAEASGAGRRLGAEQFVELAAVGVVADVAPMVGENRIIVRAGLDRLPRTDVPGLRALQQVAQVEAPVRAYDIGFRIAPRINAVGRLADAADALELLITDDEDKARRLALYLDTKNRERQRLQDRIYKEAEEMLARQPDLLELPVIVLSSPSWHIGVVGIVASKIVDDFGRPVVLLAEDHESGIARGSARSVESFDITAGLRACGDLTLACGGHPMAAGLRARIEDVPRLREALAAVAEDQGLSARRDDAPVRTIPVELAELDETLPADLARLEPFGPGNPEPLFSISGLEVVETRYVGRDSQHVKLFLTDGTMTVEAIGFGMGNGRVPAAGQNIDICFIPELDTYWGRPQVQLRLKGWRPSQGRPR